MLSFIAKAMRTKFKSAQLKNKYHFDSSDINNFIFPEYIETISKDDLQNKLKDIIEQYKKLQLKELYREEIDEFTPFCDMDILYLLKFYKSNLGLIIQNQEEIFPFWTNSYNLAPLQEIINKIVSKAYKHIESNFCKWVQYESRTFSALDVTYLLYYFVLTTQLESTTTDELE